MTSGGTERWRRMRWRAPCGAVSKALRASKEKNVVEPSPLELPLRHEQWGSCVGAREGPLLPVADHSVPCEHFRDALADGAREQLHVQLAQGYGPVVVQSGGARYLLNVLNRINLFWG